MEKGEEEEDWILVRKPDLFSENEITEEPLKIHFNEPAKHWTDALPIGNGRLGAMVWGNILSETLNLNEDTLWTGIPGNYTNPDAPAALSAVRKLVDDGKYAQATDSAVKLSGNPSDVYQLLGDMIIEFDDSHSQYNKETYIRELDLNTAKVKVTYSVLDNEYTREHFISNPDQVIVTKISASKSRSISFKVSLNSKMIHNSSNFPIGKNRILLKGSCPGSRNEPEDSTKGGIQFSAVLDLEISDGFGSIYIVDDENTKKLRVEGADWAVIRLTASSSFEGPFVKPLDSKKDPTLESVRTMDSIKELSYNEVYARHLDDYQNLFHRVSLQLWKSGNVVKDLHDSVAISTSERVKSFGEDEDPSLVELLFQYGRYLLISCSRRGAQVANLQGIWNKDIQPPWDGAQHLNINLQMNYWPSLSCNLEECQEPLFDYISCLSLNGSKTAKVNYEADGWVAHQVSDLWAKTSPDSGLALWALWPMGGAWLCTHLWEHYSFTMDKDFLKQKAYPLIKGCSLFLLDWLIEGHDGYYNYLETNPSTSPEHMFTAPGGKPASVSYSSTMDMAIIKEVFSIVVSAAKILGRSEDDDLVSRVLKAQSKLPPTRISRDGSIMEWALDFEDPDVHHRHVSHLFGLFPGHTITPEKNPDLCKAAENTLYKRGEEGPGWSTTWKAALWARLRNSEHAYRMVKRLFILVDPENESAYEGGLYSNLFTAHPPFQIDANFGFPAAVAEMLVQSTMHDLYLLPALPRDKWANGCVKGLKARGGVTVNIRWNEGNVHQVRIWSRDCNAIRRIHYRKITITATLLAGRVYTFNTQLKCVETYSMLNSDFF
ncbi:alpha-L-fucosidase 2-like [Impatiens glandulifera]|uniref:alpha-L-fucosidase 2-like n=1 Tax=Impatiens glandulifera TaxID=253017 RepID=UPI001FB183EE|nr:alpha-L-fucosidase 2-like [Impatiens glandulifera]